MNPNDLAFASALEQAKLIRTRQISPLELTKLYLDRLERLNPQLGSFFYIAAESALTEATTKTELLAKTQDPKQLPPFFGVPTAIKDLNPVAGMPYTCGAIALKDNQTNYSDSITLKMQGAGFIILGKTATSEFGALPYTEPLGFPPARNPWHLDYTAGGSSGGAAAAVAAGLCSVAQGSDGGGSIRTPASCCGIVGLKPSRGRVSHAPAGDFQNGISVNGPLTRTVADAAALLDIMSGYVTGDPYWLMAPDVPFLEVAKKPSKLLRIAFSTDVPPIGRASKICQKAVLETVKNLQDLGHFIAQGCPDFSNLVEPFARVWQAGVVATGLPLAAMSPIARWLGEQAGSAGDYLRAVAQMQVEARNIVAFFDRFDILVLPAQMHEPIKVGAWTDLEPAVTMQKIIEWIAPCPPANAAGLPAITIPVLFSNEGLPIGVQLIGKPADEATIIALAAQLEAVRPWSQHYQDLLSL